MTDNRRKKRLSWWAKFIAYLNGTPEPVAPTKPTWTAGPLDPVRRKRKAVKK